MENNQKQEKQLTREERVEQYLNTWGSDKPSLVAVLRQLIFIFGIVASCLIAAWVLMVAFKDSTNSSKFNIIVKNVSIITTVFIGFVIGLHGIYTFVEFFLISTRRKNRLPSLIFGTALTIVLIVFLILTMIEIYGSKHGERYHIYIVYMVICFAGCLFTTTFSFDSQKKTTEKFNPFNKLIRSLAYTIALLGVLAVLTYILFILGYSAEKAKFLSTNFYLARTVNSLVGCVLVAQFAELLLLGLVRTESPRWKKRVIIFTVLIAVILAFEIWSGILFTKNGKWPSYSAACKVSITLLAVSTIADSAFNFVLASRYTTYLEKK